MKKLLTGIALVTVLVACKSQKQDEANQNLILTDSAALNGQNAMADTATTSTNTATAPSKAEPKVIEKVIIKERVVQAPSQQTNTTTPTTTPAATTETVSGQTA
ncbi:MAG: hypothetical protein WBA94_11320, partial [Ferruginibacter sp.]